MTIRVPGVAAATTPDSDTAGSTYTATNASTITMEVTTAINQLVANQTHILQQMAAMSVTAPPVAALAFNILPIANVTIPTEGFQQGGGLWRGGGRGRGRGGRGIRAQRGRNPFAMHMATVGRGSAGQYIVDTPVSQEPRSSLSCSHNSSIVTGLLPTRSNDTIIGTCATPVDLTLRTDTR